MRAGKRTASEAVVTTYNPQTLSALRMSAGLTQPGLAQAIGAKPVDIARWEAGEKGIPRRMMNPLACMLRCTVQELMS